MPAGSRSRSARERLLAGGVVTGVAGTAGGMPPEGGRDSDAAMGSTQGGGPKRGGRDRVGSETGAARVTAAGRGWIRGRADADADADQFPTSGRDLTRGAV